MVSLLAFCLVQTPALQMPAVFGDHMVLQRQKPIPFFGTATPGTTVTVKLENQFATTKVAPDGTWKLELRPREAGGPYLLEVSGDGYLRFEDVMVGEVWLASGQSNMEWTVGMQNDISKARTDANPNVRFYTVSRAAKEKPEKNVTGSGWVPVDSNNVVYMSAVGFWFASDIYRWLNIPVGIIHASWGGTPAESWVRRPALLANPSLSYLVTDYLAGLGDFPQRKAAYDQELTAYKERAFAKDTSNEGSLNGWQSLNLFTGDWRKVKLPNLLEVTEGEQMDGAVWYRKSLDLPKEWLGRQLVIELGTIADFDDTYFNGRRIGGVDHDADYPYAVPRRYFVAPGMLRETGNVLSVRVFNRAGNGGFTGATETLRIYPADGSAAPIPLAGDWISRVERRVSPPDPKVVGNEPDKPYGPGHPWSPGSLWNGMIAPYVGYGMRGAIWYQGESNVERAEEYRTLFPTLITDWRSQWGIGDFPFYYVQLAGYTAQSSVPSDSNWAELRDAQRAALDLPNTGMALALDLGDANDIHPRNKLEVGRRLSVMALARQYGIDIKSRGPHFKSLEIKDHAARVTFDDSAGLRTFDGATPRGFAIAGADHRYFWANARIEKGTVVLSSPDVLNPVYARYAWGSNPDVNLYNDAALPAEPFRTDDFPWLTAGARKK